LFISVGASVSHFSPLAGGNMKVGDLVTSIGFGLRVGLIEQVWKAETKCLVRVIWGCGAAGNYYARQLEVI
jgi:hypothetical protein